MIRSIKVVSCLVAFAVVLPSVASAQMEQPMADKSAMSHKMTKKQMMMRKKKMMMHKKMMKSGGM